MRPPSTPRCEKSESEMAVHNAPHAEEAEGRLEAPATGARPLQARVLRDGLRPPQHEGHCAPPSPIHSSRILGMCGSRAGAALLLKRRRTKGTRVATTDRDHTAGAGASLAERLTAFFADAGYARTEPPRCSRPASSSICPARTSAAACSSTSDADGAEWALRPEYTIPVARFPGRRRAPPPRQSQLLRPGVPAARG